MASTWLTCPECGCQFLHNVRWPPICPDCGYNLRQSSAMPANSISAPDDPLQPAPRREMSRRTAILGCLTFLVLVVGLIVGIAVVPLGDGRNVAINHPTAPASSGAATTGPIQTRTATRTPTSTPTPPATLKWTTVQSFKGSNSGDTPPFNVPNDWRLVWGCNPSSFFANTYNLIVDIGTPGGPPVRTSAVNVICQAGHTGDVVQQHQGGTIFLHVTSEGSWTLQVQVLK